MPDMHLREASRLLFGDPKWALQHWMAGQLDDKFEHEDGRRISVNELAAELRNKAAE